MAFVEDQVDDREDRVEPFWKILRGWDRERNPASRILATPRTRRCAIVAGAVEERARDLLGREPAHFLERERHANRSVDRRVTAGEDEPQAVVFNVLLRPCGVDPGNLREPSGKLWLQSIEATATPKRIERLESPGRNEPSPGIVRNTLLGPMFNDGREHLVERLLSEIEVAQESDERREDPAR